MTRIAPVTPYFAASPRRDAHREAMTGYITHSAQGGNAQAQFDRGMALYDSVPTRTRFRLALTPGRFKKSVPDALVEAYKWFSLAKMKRDGVEGFIDSWMTSTRRMIGKSGAEEAKRRADLWLAEFEPDHRGGGFVDELRQAVMPKRNVTE